MVSDMHSIREKEMDEILGKFWAMTKDDIMHELTKRIYYDEDFGVNEWKIYVDDMKGDN